MTIEEWLRAASEDAERRQLPELTPRLAALAAATRRLRGASWNREAVPPTPDPPASRSKTGPPETARPTREGEAAPPVLAPATRREP